MGTVVCILGPTASGKTAVACELSKLLDCQLISVDSSQIYRRMDLGSAKPTPQELIQFPHELIDVREPWETYSAADFCRDATRLIGQAVDAGRLPVLVGGTMLYFKAFAEGLAPLPPADASVRERIETMAVQDGWAAVHDKLAAVDPQSAKRIHPNDPQRIQRALEVHLLTGRALSEWHAATPDGGYQGTLKQYALYPEERKLIHLQINQRFDTMLERGLVDEVRALQAEPQIHAELPSQRAVGYRQTWQYLDGSIDYERLLESGKAATRQLAKRQLTWIRGMSSLVRYDSFITSPADIAARIAKDL